MDEALRVLLVDDEELYAESLAKVLRRRGMVVATAKDGPAALAWMEANEVDVVVLDLKMPGMDGLATLEEIMLRDSTTAVIMLTGHIDLERVTKALQGEWGTSSSNPAQWTPWLQP
ncbi:MAG: response regulator transcription factor [Thermodesulfobacteriota bacterium]